MTRRWDAWLAVAGLVLITAWTVYRITDASGEPGSYYRFRHGEAGFVYPTTDVVTWCGGIVAEMLLACVLILRTKNTAAACALLAVTMLALLFAFGILAMHAPPYVGGAIAYQLIAGAWLLLVAIVAGIARLVAKRS